MDKYQCVAVHAVIRRDDGRFLVTKRSFGNDYLPNLWDLPGGSVEIGEDVDRALAREINEETGLKVANAGPIYVCSEFQHNLRHQIRIIYGCNLVEGKVKLNPEEHSTYQWVNLEEARKLSGKILFLEKLLEETGATFGFENRTGKQ